MVGGEITIKFTIQLIAETNAEFECAALTLRHRMSMVLPSKTVLCRPYANEKKPSKVELVKVTRHPVFVP